ncbi:MAG: hypothetical protein ISR64_00175 [Deltaproteobacteria bacterium]|nr:hypothetical protein [Deltaproteobacteria bacterium]
MIDPTLVNRIREFIGSARDPDDGAFVTLCRAVARAQGRLGAGSGLEAIEPVPEGAFKLSDVAHFPRSRAQATFRTSGTTTGRPGLHLVRDMDLYRRSALAGFERYLLYPPRPGRFVSLIPPAPQRPGSSLSHMVSMVMEAFAGEQATFARKGNALALTPLMAAVREAVDSREPLVLLGTSLDLLTLFEALEHSNTANVALPRGSRVMHTGGDKASGRAITREKIWQGLDRYFQIPPEDVVEEFGMTELLSQAYDAPRVVPGQRRLVPVPWMRTRVLDPTTFTEVDSGSRGLLCHYDLANCHTAVAVLTSDLGLRINEGFSHIHRVPGSTPRGCSHEAARGVRTHV